MKKLFFIVMIGTILVNNSRLNAEQGIQDMKPAIVKGLNDIKQAVSTLQGVNQTQIQKNFIVVIDKALSSVNEAFADVNNSAKFKTALDAVQILQNDWVNLYQTDPAAVSKTSFEFKIATAKVQHNLTQVYTFALIKNGIDKVLYDAFSAAQ